MAPRRPQADDDVPRLPRGKGWGLSFPQLLRIGMVAVALVAVVVLTRPCADATSKFVTGFDDTDAAVIRLIDAGAPPPPSGTLLRADMTPEQLEAAIAKERAAAATDAGPDAAPTPVSPDAAAPR